MSRFNCLLFWLPSTYHTRRTHRGIIKQTEHENAAKPIAIRAISARKYYFQRTRTRRVVCVFVLHMCVHECIRDTRVSILAFMPLGLQTYTHTNSLNASIKSTYFVDQKPLNNHIHSFTAQVINHGFLGWPHRHRPIPLCVVHICQCNQQSLKTYADVRVPLIANKMARVC